MQSEADVERTGQNEGHTGHLPDSLRADDVDLRSLINHRVAVQIADTTESVFTRFAKSETEFMAVLDRERLVGICSTPPPQRVIGWTLRICSLGTQTDWDASLRLTKQGCR